MRVRFGHIADTHLGYTTGNKKTDEDVNMREQDGYDLFHLAISQMIEEDIDFLIIAGDLFHSPKPTIRTLNEVSKAFRKLVEHNIPVYIITGNHDTSDIVSDKSAVLPYHFPEVGVFAYEDPLKVEEIKDDDGNVLIKLWLVSHQGILSQEKTMEQLNPDPEEFNMLVAHGSLYDEVYGGVLSTELEPREVVLPEDVLSLPWDLVLLGHIHTRQQIGDNRFYSGSLFRRGFADKEGDRGWTLWDIDTDSKEISKKDFTLPQRAQMELLINAEDKTVSEIQEELEVFFKELDKHSYPIARVVFERLDIDYKTMIDWRPFKDTISQCLTFSVVYKKSVDKSKETKREVIDNFQGDLVGAYVDFLDDTKKESLPEEDFKLMKEKGKEFLNKGIDKVL